MWHRVEAPSRDYPEVWLVDSEGNEWRYDYAAVPPGNAPALEDECGKMLLERPDLAPGLANWLLVRARMLRDNPREIYPQWWSSVLGFLPVGPAPRESVASWSVGKRRPAEFMELLVRKQRIHFSTPGVPVHIETLNERRFAWTGS